MQAEIWGCLHKSLGAPCQNPHLSFLGLLWYNLLVLPKGEYISSQGKNVDLESNKRSECDMSDEETRYNKEQSAKLNKQCFYWCVGVAAAAFVEASMILRSWTGGIMAAILAWMYYCGSIYELALPAVQKHRTWPPCQYKEKWHTTWLVVDVANKTIAVVLALFGFIAVVSTGIFITIP